MTWPDAAQPRRVLRVFHHQEIAGTATPMACPPGVTGPSPVPARLLFPPVARASCRKRSVKPNVAGMRRGSQDDASAETLRLALRRVRDGHRRVRGHSLGSRPATWHSSWAPDRVDDALETIDLSAAPALLRSPIKPPDPKQDIEATHKGADPCSGTPLGAVRLAYRS